MKNQGTGISWTHRPGTKGETWNPTIGCERASPGCLHCYAESMAGRIVRMAGPAALDYAKVIRTNNRGLPVWNRDVLSMPDRLDMPLRAKAPRTYFVNSMSDLFHDDVPDEFIAAVFGVMAACQRHRFIILTKRAERLPKWFAWYEKDRNPNRYRHPELIEHAAVIAGNEDALFAAANEAAGRNDWPLPNVELGVSCENQEWFDKRVHHLLRTPAAVRLVSLEPLLGPIDIDDARWPTCVATKEVHDREHSGGEWCDEVSLDWVIVGGESGDQRRECEPAWIDDIVKQCAESGTRCFVKQDGARKPGQQGRLSDATWAVKQFPLNGGG